MAESSPGPVYLDSPQFNFRTGDTIYYVDGSAASLFWAITLAVAFLQFGVLPGLSGWTPGKLATGLRVRGSTAPASGSLATCSVRSSGWPTRPGQGSPPLHGLPRGSPRPARTPR
jgi:hypothetical protein